MNWQILQDKRKSGAAGKHKSKADKKKSKYRQKWKRGEE